VSGIDRSAERWLVAHRIGALDPVAVALSWIGTHALVWLLLAAILALLRRRPAILLATGVAVVVASGLTTLIKDGVGRPRPPQALHVQALVHVPTDPSFPSGHASSSFACALVLAWALRHPGARAGLLLLAAAIAASRAYVGVHYPFDVVAGALLGCVVGAAVVLAAGPLERRRPHRKPDTRPTAGCVDD
jgi:undecaprenyl-diphosphatase